MKIRYIVLWILAAFLLFWGGSMLYCSHLTALYGDEFTDFEAMDFDHMHAWSEPPELRVLNYSDVQARVYYYSEHGGECAVFTKVNGQWRYQENDATWVDFGGTADDYFVWPYFRNWVP